MATRPLHWKAVQDVNHKKVLNRVVIVVDDDHDVIHDNNSSDLTLSTSLNDLDFATLNIDGQKTHANDTKYGHIKNHMKTIKNKQARTRDRKSEQRPEAKPGKVKPSVKMVKSWSTKVNKTHNIPFSPSKFH
ncbi:hypothetical protein Tco_1465618 [Tanacetum coccineum]